MRRIGDMAVSTPQEKFKEVKDWLQDRFEKFTGKISQEEAEESYPGNGA